MKLINPMSITLTLLTSCYFFYAFALRPEKDKGKTSTLEKEALTTQQMNFFLTHGHCCTPFSGKSNNLKLELSPRTDLGNPIENMSLSFDIDPKTFNTCSDKTISERLKLPGLFYTEADKLISFKTLNTNTMGIDWY